MARLVWGGGGFISEVSLDPPPRRVERELGAGAPLLFLNDLWVHPMHRGKGRGGALILAALVHASELESDVWLYVKPYGLRRTRGGRRVPRPTVQELEGLYAQFGFATLRREPRTEMVWRHPAQSLQ